MRPESTVSTTDQTATQSPIEDRNLICPHCQTPFTTKNVCKTYCSPTCSSATRRARFRAHHQVSDIEERSLAAAEGRRASLARRRESGEIMGMQLHKLRTAEHESRDGRPVLVRATAEKPEHIHFTLDGAKWNEAAKRWRWQAPGVWRTIALAGHGCGLRIEKDTLVVRHGRTCSSDDPATYKLYRGAHDVSCIVLLSNTGSLSLSGLASVWWTP